MATTTPARTSTAASRSQAALDPPRAHAARGEIDVGVDRDDGRRHEAEDQEALFGSKPPQPPHVAPRVPPARGAAPGRSVRCRGYCQPPAGRRGALRAALALAVGLRPVLAESRRRTVPGRADVQCSERRGGTRPSRPARARSLDRRLGPRPPARPRRPAAAPVRSATAAASGCRAAATALGVGRQRDRLTRLPGPAGAADAVDVVLRHQRQVEVDHQRQLLDVEAAGGHVGGDQHGDAAGLEVAEGPLAGALRLVAVDDGGAQAGVLEVTADAVRAVLGACRTPAPGATASAVRTWVSRSRFCSWPTAKTRCTTLAATTSFGGDVDAHRLAGEGLGDGRHFGRQRRRQQQRLAGRRHGGHHPLQRRQEAHVEHPVGFVEGHDLDRRQVDGPPVEVIDEPARRGDDDVDAAAQGPHLRHDRLAADQRHGAQAGAPARSRAAIPAPGARARGSAPAPGRAAAARRRSRRPAARSSAARRPRSCRCRSGRGRARRGPPGRAEWPRPGPAWAWYSPGARAHW